ncbi:hypothetical protein BDV93DRAFT_237735 [Ceratobasidium sp. AG-I]|nr:hypothetical protein BDV93DRAFT_237735 [Ceratobasidium sp. AG-I]
MERPATPASDWAASSRLLSEPRIPPPPAQNWTAHEDKYASKEPNPVTRAAYTKDDGTILFFANTLALHVINQHTTPKPPIVIFQLWPNLLRAGVPLIDAILPDVRLAKTHHIGVFWNDRYVRLNELTGEIIDGPYEISQAWTALRDAGFQTVDAVFLHPSGGAVFFSRDQYATVTFDILKTGVRSKLIDSGPFAACWPSLTAFKAIDYVLVERTKEGQATFFSGEDCISTGIGSSVDEIKYVSSTKPSERSRITDCWEALKGSSLY